MFSFDDEIIRKFNGTHGYTLLIYSKTKTKSSSAKIRSKETDSC